MQIYIHRNGTELGPFSKEATFALLQEGKFFIADYARTEEMPEYQTIGELLGVDESPMEEAAAGLDDRSVNEAVSGPEQSPVNELAGGVDASPMSSSTTLNEAVAAAGTPETAMASRRQLSPVASCAPEPVLAGPVAVMASPRGAAMARLSGQAQGKTTVVAKKRTSLMPVFMGIVLAAAGAYVSLSPRAENVRAYLLAALEAFRKSPNQKVAAAATPAPQMAVAPVVTVIQPEVPEIPAEPEPPAPPAPVEFNPAKLAENPAAWPKAVRLMEDVFFPAVLDGRAVGTVKVLAGSTAKLIKIAGESLTLEYQGGRVQIPWKLTNLEEAAAQAEKQFAAKQPAATPAPVLAVAAKPTPPVEVPVTGGSWMWKGAGPNYGTTKVDANSVPESYALERSLLASKYQMTPEVVTAYLRFSKARALREITNSRSLLPADFLSWIDSDPIVATTVYGARKDAAGVLCMLRSLEIDLGRDTVRKEYTQLALAIAVAEAANGATVDLSQRPLLKLTIPGDPRKPVDTKAKDRALDVNDHIINFLEDHAPIQGEAFGPNQRPPELKYDSKGVAILTVTKAAKDNQVSKMKRAVLAADVMESKELQDEFNAYMAAHGQSARIDCGDHQIFPNRHEAVSGPYADGIKKAYLLFRTAYEAKGRLPASRDAFATPAERMAFLIRNDDHFPSHKEGQKKWDRFPLRSAAWPAMALLAAANDPLREREEVWQRFADTGEAITYGEYIDGIAQQFDFQSARRLSPYPFTYGSFQMMLKDGGVCGTMANMSVRTHTALGTPACTAGQPGHCALIVFAYDKKTHDYVCKGEQYATGGDDKTHPHANWIFGDTDARRDMVWHQSVAWGVNAGFQSYLDSMVALNVYRNLPKATQKTQGLTLLGSGLAMNRYNIALVEAAAGNGDGKGGLEEFGGVVKKLLGEHGNTAATPAKGLYNTTVQQILEKRGGKGDDESKEASRVPGL